MKRERQPAATRILAVSLLEVGCGPRSAPTLDSSGIVTLTPGPDPTATVQIAPPSPELWPNTATSVATPTQPAVETYIAYVQTDAVFSTQVFGGRPLDTQQSHQSELADGIYNMGWSPSGDDLALNMVVLPSE